MNFDEAYKERVARVLRGSGRAAVGSTCVAIVTGAMITPSLIYVGQILLIAAAWAGLTLLAWRFRSPILEFVGTTVLIMGGGNITRMTFPYDKRLTFQSIGGGVFGFCVALGFGFILLWLFRDAIARFCRINPSA